METELKKAIIDKVFESEKEFQVANYLTEDFRDYIYDKDGDYLIGGKKVAEFIKKVIDLIINY